MRASRAFVLSISIVSALVGTSCVGVFVEAGALWNTPVQAVNAPDRTQAEGPTFLLGAGVDFDIARKARIAGGVSMAQVSGGDVGGFTGTLPDARVDFNLANFSEDTKLRMGLGLGVGEGAAQLYGGLGVAHYLSAHHGLSFLLGAQLLGGEVAHEGGPRSVQAFGPAAKVTYVFSFGNTRPDGRTDRSIAEDRRQQKEYRERHAKYYEAALACEKGEDGACSTACDSLMEYFSDDRGRTASVTASGACRRICDGGDLRGCARLGEKLNGAGKHVEAREVLEKACNDGLASGFLGGCQRLARYYPNDVSAELKTRVVDGMCDIRDSAGCFMQSMNRLVAGAPVEEVLPTVEKSCKTYGSGERDNFGSCDLFQCLSATDVKGNALDRDTRQVACLAAENTAATNFDWMATYNRRVGTALPWSKDGLVAVDVLPTRGEWLCCGWYPGTGYTGGAVSVCARTAQACTQRANAFPRSGAGWEFSPPTKARSKTANCFTTGADYWCADGQVACDGLRTQVTSAAKSQCVPVGNYER